MPKDTDKLSARICKINILLGFVEKMEQKINDERILECAASFENFASVVTI